MLALEKQTGIKNPRLLSRPKLRTELVEYMNEFRTLSLSRQFNEAGILPIQISEIEAYLRMKGVPPGAAQLRHLRFIQALDSVHVEWYYNKRNKDLKNNKKK